MSAWFQSTSNGIGRINPSAQLSQLSQDVEKLRYLQQWQQNQQRQQQLQRNAMLAAAASSASAATSAQASDEEDVVLLEGAAVYQVPIISPSIVLKDDDENSNLALGVIPH